MIRHFFVTGTDTDCGKTLVTLGFMHLMARAGYRVAGMKPVACGAIDTPGGLRNQDAMAIGEQCTETLPYGQVNPYCFEPPIAPHLAAEQADETILLSVLKDSYTALASVADAVIVEGAGGWRVPLGGKLDIAGLCAALDLPAVLVVGMRLGCLNHALLSAESIQRENISLAGWVANCVDPEMQYPQQNIQTLASTLDAPLLGELPFMSNPTPAKAATYLDIPG